jgi:hypothetical protein
MTLKEKTLFEIGLPCEINVVYFWVINLGLIRTYAEEENCEAIFRRGGSEFIILRMHL